MGLLSSAPPRPSVLRRAVSPSAAGSVPAAGGLFLVGERPYVRRSPTERAGVLDGERAAAARVLHECASGRGGRPTGKSRRGLPRGHFVRTPHTRRWRERSPSPPECLRTVGGVAARAAPERTRADGPPR